MSKKLHKGSGTILMPVVVFVFSILGLVTALLGAGWWNFIACLFLSVPLYSACNVVLTVYKKQ